MFECMYALTIYLLLKHFYWKFGNMTVVIWESPKFATTDKIASHKRKPFQHMDQDLNFYKNIALLFYFQTSLAPLSFDKYNLRYLFLIHRCPILGQIWTSKMGRLLKIHSLSFYYGILYAYTIFQIN